MFLSDISKKDKTILLLSLLGSTFTGALFLRSIFNLKKSIKQKNKIQHLRVYRPSEIQNKIQKNDAQISDQFQQVDIDLIKGQSILIQGIGMANDPVQSIFKQRNPRLIHRRIINVKKYSNEGFFKNAHIHFQSKHNVLKYMNKNYKKVNIQTVKSFQVLDPQDSSICNVEINNKQKNKTLTILDSCIDHLASSSKKYKLSLFKQFLYGFLCTIQVAIWPINALISNSPFIKGIKIGEENYEVGISSGKVITVLGDLVYDFNKNKMHIENPLYIMRDRRGILDYFQLKIEKNVHKVLYYSIPFLIACSYTIFFIHHLQKSQVNKIKNKKFKNMKNLEEVNPNISDEMKCVICVDKARSVILKPCMHTLMCTKCLKMVKKDSNKCPICKVNIEDYIEILVDNKK